MTGDGRPSASDRGLLSLGDLEVDSQAWQVRLRGVPVDLTKTEFLALTALASRAGAVVPTPELYRTVWGDNWFGDDNHLAVVIHGIRSKLGQPGASNEFIQTVRGVGYRLDAGPGSRSTRRDGAQSGAVSVAVLLDTQRTIRWSSDNVAQLLGWGHLDLIGTQVFDLAHPDDVPIFLAVRAALDDGHSATFTARFRTSSGEHRPVTATVRPVLAADGEAVGMLAEWRPAQQSLDLKDVMPIVLAPSPGAGHVAPVTLTFDGQATLQSISPSVTVGDWHPEEILGRQWSPFDQRGDLIPALARMHGPATDIAEINLLVLKDGSRRPVYTRTAVTRDAAGNPQGSRVTLYLDAPSGDDLSRSAHQEP